jgi:cytochrome c peroxidase
MSLYQKIIATSAPGAVILIRLIVGGVFLSEGIQKSGCIRCHNGPTLSDGKFYRLGVGFADRGRGAITGEKSDLFAFRTPALRDIALTGPYMHDGSFETLSSVVEFYYRGVPRQSPDGSALDLEPLLSQSYSEIPAVVAFLESLTGEPIQMKPPKLP